MLTNIQETLTNINVNEYKRNETHFNLFFPFTTRLLLVNFNNIVSLHFQLKKLFKSFILQQYEYESDMQ